MDVPLKGSRDNRDLCGDNENKYSLRKYLQIGHVHGLKYLGRNGKFETLFWLITILLSSLLVGVFAVVLYGSSASTLMIKADLPARPINSLPFPSITVCSETKARASLVNFTDAYHSFHAEDDDSVLSDEEVSRVEALSQICDPHLFESMKLREKPTTGENLLSIHREISLQQEFIALCQFQRNMMPCSELFEETITDDGICYTFNKLKGQFVYKTGEEGSLEGSEKSWNLRSGFDENINNSFPHRAAPGTESGLNVVLMMQTANLDFICKGPVQGYKVRIHAPDEHPWMSKGFQRIGLNSESLIAVKSKVSFNQDYEGVNCHSTSSKTLRHFKRYSHENCITECLSSYVEMVCGCLKFTMIHDNSSNICTQHDTKCVTDAVKNFTTHKSDDFLCDCKPTCDSLNYETKMSQAEFSFKNTFSAFKENLEGEFPKTAMSRLIVYMDEDFYVPSTYIQSQTTFEYIAKLGGVLALFLGASWISLIEIIYFFMRKVSS